MKKKFVSLAVIMAMLASLFPVIGIAAEEGNTASGTTSAHNVQVAAGYGFSIILKSDGTVWTFGINRRGQLGDGTKINSSIPKQVIGLTDVCAVSAGTYHSLALKNDGTVWAWGYNNYGQLGNGTTIDSSIPVQVSGLTNIKTIECGGNYSVALKGDGTLYAWGLNSYGQLGDGTTENKSIPIEVIGVSNIKELSAGNCHMVVLKTDGTVCTWGYNGYGQLGNGTAENSSTQIVVEGLTDVESVAAGSYHTVALKTNGTVYTWGYNERGQLGYGGPTNFGFDYNQYYVPAIVSSLADVKTITAGDNNTFALKKDGTLYAFGQNNIGQLGNGKVSSCYYTPDLVLGLKDIKEISAGNSHTLALTEDKSIYAWGNNGNGQLGYELVENSSMPVEVYNLTDVNFVKCGNSQVLALKKDGTAYAWGYDQNRLFNGNIEFCATPIEINAFNNIEDAALGSAHTVVLSNDKTVYTCGYNNYGQLGNGTTTTSNMPVQVDGFNNVEAVDAGEYYTVILKQNGTVYTCGQNNYGQLGNGTTENSSTFVEVSGLTDVKAIAAGAEHVAALKNDGSVWTWGRNNKGQLGNGTIENSAIPLQVSGLTGIKAIFAGGSDTFAIKSDGTICAWGENNYGQLGNGTTENSSMPIEVSGLTDINYIAAGGRHTAALKKDGTVYTWGNNDCGQLGNGTKENSSIPIKLSEVTKAEFIDCEFYSTALVCNDGTAYMCGDNIDGLLGIGLTEYSYIPYKVRGGINTPYNYIKSINNLTETVEPNTDISAINLPSQVSVTLDDDSDKTLNVIWDTSTYVPQQTGEQIIYGTVQLEDGIRNTQNHRAEYKVTIALPPDIMNIEEIYAVQITADQGLPLGVGEKFHADGNAVTTVDVPETVTARLKGGDTKELNVTWDDSSYDPFNTNEQTITGTVELIGGVKNPDNITARLEVTVVPAEYFVFARTPESISIEVLAGTTKEEIYEQLMPKTIDVVAVNAETYEIVYIYSDYTFSDDYQENINFDPTQAGVQKLIGRFNSAITDAHIEPYIEIEVNVVKRTVKSAAAAMIGNVALGTSFEDISMPDKAGVIYTDNSTEEFSVTWDGSTYNPQKLGAQIVYGSFADPLPVYVENPKNRRPMAGITVVDPTTTILSAKPLEEIQLMYSSEYSVNNIDMQEESIPGYIIRDYEVELLHEDGSITTEIMPLFEEVNN